MIVIEKKKLIDKIIESAKSYEKNLNNKNIMFIYLEGKEIKYLETKFTKANFMHLTGIKVTDNKIRANLFYRKSIKNRLKESEIEEREDGNTQKKLSVLNCLMHIHKNAKMIGEYNQNKIFLFSDKIIGNVVACLGFIQKENYYVCNTSLKEDIRKLVLKPYKIICIVEKKIQDAKYNQITYINRKYQDKIFLDKEIDKKISKKIKSCQ